MSGLEWDKNFFKAKLSTGKVTELRNLLLDEIIPRLNQRREWTRCVNAYNPNLASVLQPDLQSEHVLEQFQRVFVLIFDSRKDVWRVCFVRDLRKKKPPHDGAGDGAIDPANDPSSDDPTDGAPSRRDITEHIAPLIGYARFAADHALWLVRDEVKRLLDRTPWLAALIARPRRASLSQLMREAYVRAHAASGARLERRRVPVGRQSVEISSFINWEGFIFGKTLEQELFCADGGPRF